MRVELLYVEDDPTVMQARQRLVEVLTEDAFETTIQMIVVGSLDDAELLAFPGSPTVRIDGADIDPAAVAAPVSLAPRHYAADEPGGTTSAVPGKRLIRRAVERARGWGHGRG